MPSMHLLAQVSPDELNISVKLKKRHICGHYRVHKAPIPFQEASPDFLPQHVSVITREKWASGVNAALILGYA